MSIFDQLLAKTQIPAFHEVKYHLPRGEIREADIPGIVAESLNKRELLARISPGSAVAIAVGSREIRNIHVIVKSLVGLLKERGAKPFVIPAMGSHGGATAEGQRQVLAHYGVTEESVGAPIRASMETVKIGQTPDGLDVCIDRHAAEADHLIPVGRVKPHTDFQGEIESGLHKMLAIGCGKQYGANICHAFGFGSMAKNVVEIATEILSKHSIPFGVAIIEDAFHNTHKIATVPGENFPREERELLKEAKTLITPLPFEKVDVLVIEEAGKNISGAAMDPNVTGRSTITGRRRPFVENLVLLNLAEKTHGNANGIGNADVTTRRCFDKIDMEATYPNGLTSRDLACLKIPAVMPDDRNAIRLAIHACVEHDRAIPHRIVWMKNTLKLEQFYISESLIPEAKAHPKLTLTGGRLDLDFDPNGNLPWIR